MIRDGPERHEDEAGYMDPKYVLSLKDGCLTAEDPLRGSVLGSGGVILFPLEWPACERGGHV
jgi:hypothetical protein